MSDQEIEKKRKTSLFKMAAKVALKQSKNVVMRAKESKLKNMVSQAHVVVEHVGKLKGAAMKAVQMITLEGRDFLPPEVLKILETLQSQSLPLSNEEMMRILKQELGTEKFSELADISVEPLAAASIGQVYQGVVEDGPVAIKIQYPGIAESVDSDIAALKKIVKGLLFVNRKRIDIDELFEETLRVIKLETDYENELKMHQAYRNVFSGRAGYLVPEVYPSYSTKRVLTTELVDADEFSVWLAKNPSKQRKQALGKKILDLFKIEFFENRIVQTDPNPANFLVAPDDSLVLLDFGATVIYDVEFADSYMSLLSAFFTRSEDLESVLESFGFIDSREAPELRGEFVDFIQTSLIPFLPENQPFDFGGDAYVEQVRKKAFSFTKKIKYSAPPKKIIFLHRKLGGIFQLLRMLDVEMDLTPFCDHVVAAAETSVKHLEKQREK